MSGSLALSACALFILWLLAKERRATRERVSAAVWIPLAWLLILASKPVSAWLGQGVNLETTEDYLEGSPLDRMVFLALIVAGLAVLAKRRVNWQAFAQKNRWLCAYLLWLAVSATWSDYPFVSFKRWTKEFGNVVMVLVLLSEVEPVAAVKFIFTRCAYILIPLSVVFIRYYSDLGRYYDRWTGTVSYCGVTADKNQLGITLAVSALFLVQRFLDARRPGQPGAARVRGNFPGLLLVALMTVYLFHLARCSTALFCALLGGAIVVGASFRAVRGRLKWIWNYAFAAAAILGLLQACFDVEGTILGALGRDETLTGRSDIWQLVLREEINPLIGTGYYTFWMGDRAQKFSDATEARYSFRLNEAHNGYLETYLNNGLIGVGFLVLMLVATGRKLRNSVLNDGAYGALRLAVFIATIAYNFSESMFSRLSPIWFAFLVVSIEYPRRRALPRRPNRVETADNEGRVASGALG